MNTIHVDFHMQNIEPFFVDDPIILPSKNRYNFLFACLKELKKYIDYK